MAHPRDLEDFAQVPAFRVPVCLPIKQGKVAVRTFQYVLWADKARGGQFERRHGSSRIQPDLQSHGGGALDMRLHGAGQMAVHNAKCIVQLCPIEPG